MQTSCGFIVTVEDEVDFYEIKRFIQSLPNTRLIYCTRNPRCHLYIKTEEQLIDNGELPNER
jgi:hypothetical protein